jgi:hypothetical protein
MTFDQFKAIIADMESDLEGDGYAIRVLTKHTGQCIDGVWRWAADQYDVIVIEVSRERDHASVRKRPDVYVPLSSIVTIQGPFHP